jgi:hypothetical protein
VSIAARREGSAMDLIQEPMRSRMWQIDHREELDLVTTAPA